MTSTSWISVPQGSHFSLKNVPFGIISTAADSKPRPAVRIGDNVLDLAKFSAQGGFANSGFNDTQVFSEPVLNEFASLGRKVHQQVRAYLQEVFTAGGKYADVLEKNVALQKDALYNIKDTTSHMPMRIGDYTDFYVGLNHAYNCGCLFRDPKNALQPNYYHLPVGYHGRASSVVVTGTDIHRPYGQILENPKAEVKKPITAECRRLDYELEFAAFVSKPNKMGHRIKIEDAEDHIFGYVLMNDLSARDVQAWEYIPLGPFTSKNFGTVITPWVVLHDALVPFGTTKLSRPESAGPVQPYLQEKGASKSIFDIALQVELKTAEGDSAILTNGSTKNMLYSFPQMVAHHTLTGCNLNTGDLLGSGTISGSQDGTYGSLLELSNGGANEISVGSSKRKFLNDNDTVIFRAAAHDPVSGDYVGFGDCSTKILPAIPLDSHL